MNFKRSNIKESHFKVGDEVVCKASGMEGEVVKVDPEEKGKYYTVKREDGKMMKYAPDELKLEDDDEMNENYSKKSTASLQRVHDKYKDRPMSPSSANELKAIRRELQKRGAMKKVTEGAKPYISMDDDGHHVMTGSGKIHKSFPNNKDGYRAAQAHMKKHFNKLNKESVEEKLDPSMGAGEYIKDFRKSDAPQFKGKSDKKKQQMAIAAYLDARRKKGMAEEVELEEKVMNSDKSGPGKGKPMKSLSRDQHMAAMRHHEQEQMKHDRAGNAKQGNYHADMAKAHRHSTGGSAQSWKEEVEQVDEVSKDMKKRYLDKAVPSHYKKFTGKEPTTKQQLDKRRAAIQKVSKELKGKKHFSDLGEEVKVEEGAVKKTNKTYKNTLDALRGARYKLNNPVPDRDPKHKTTQQHNKAIGRSLRNEETELDEASQVLIKKMQQLAGGPDKMPRGAEFRALKKRAQDELKKDKAAKKAAPAPAKPVTKTSKGKVRTGSAESADKHIIMQMRKAQDYGKGSHSIRISPTRSVKVPHTLINKALDKHDSMQKPEDKRKFRIQLIKALRKQGK